MPVKDAAHRRKADAGAFEFILRVQALKRAEELRGMSHVETRAVVAHAVDGLPVDPLRAELDTRKRNSASEFPRVAEQIVRKAEKLPLFGTLEGTGTRGRGGS